MDTTGADIDMLRAEYEAMTRREWDALLTAAHPDFELKTPAGGPMPETHSGPARARQAFADFFGPYEEVTVVPEQFFERGDQVIVLFVQSCRPRGINANVEVRAAHVWTLRDGKPARLEVVPDRDKALRLARS